MNEQNLSLLDEMMAPNFVDHRYKSQSLESSKQALTQLYKGIPDWHTSIEDIVAEDDKVWVRYIGKGTNTGEFMGLPPTGKKITGASVVIYRIVNAKVVERWSVVDMLDFYKQLDVIEYTEQGKKLFPQDIS